MEKIKVEINGAPAPMVALMHDFARAIEGAGAHGRIEQVVYDSRTDQPVVQLRGKFDEDRPLDAAIRVLGRCCFVRFSM